MQFVSHIKHGRFSFTYHCIYLVVLLIYEGRSPVSQETFVELVKFYLVFKCAYVQA